MDKIVFDKNKLKVKSRETSVEEVSRLKLVERLKASNATAWTDGCGLAAVQIGVNVRFAWFIYKGTEHTLLNPEIIFKIGKYTHEEGCLSIPNNYSNVVRYDEIEYITGGKKRKAKGHKAAIIQHEIDHMNGVIITDKEAL